MIRTLGAPLLCGGLLVLLAGCQGDEAHFPFGEHTEDDDSTPPPDDDDSTPLPQNAPPTVCVTDVQPDGGDMLVSFDVSDPDGDAVDVFLEFTLQLGDFGAALVPTVNPVELADLPDGSYVARWAFANDIEQESGVFQLRSRGHDGTDYGDWCTFPADGSGYPFDAGTVGGEGAFFEPGVIEVVNFDSAGDAIVRLNDGTIGSNVGMRFLMVLVNEGGTDAAVTLEEISGQDSPSLARPTDGGVPRPLTRLRAPSSHAGPPAAVAAGPAACLDELEPGDVGVLTRDIAIRSGLDAADRETHPGVLRALADGIAIYVDEFVPIDQDSDCEDDLPPEEIDFRDAHGFDNCDLQEVADVTATNILPNLQDLFGEISDVDQDCRVTVFISNQLNGMTITDGDETNDADLVRSYAEPYTDLFESDPGSNPLSNEQEILYVYAPDPVPYWNRNATVELDSYLNYDLAGQIAIAAYKTISYARHVGISTALADPQAPPPGTPLVAWLDDGLALLAADIVGFGATVHGQAWSFLDHAYVKGLAAGGGDLMIDKQGGAYLFARYFYDVVGQPFLDQVNAAVPDDAILAGVSELLGGHECGVSSPVSCAVLKWATALAVSGRTDDEGDPLVAEIDIQNFRSPGTIHNLPPDVAPYPPAPGAWYGANGYQTGFQVRGINRAYTGGTDPAGPTELTDRRVLAENVDPSKFMPTTDFAASIAGSYGVAVIEISQLVSDETTLKVGSDGTLVGYIIRNTDEPDSSEPRLDLEVVAGALQTVAQPLSALPEDGSEVCVIGHLDASATISIEPTGAPSEEEEEGEEGDDDSASTDDDNTAEIVDTDRYLLVLPFAGTQRIGIHMDTRYEGSEALVNVGDPWFAIALADDIPDHQAQDFPCSSPWEQYPVYSLSYVHEQLDLISDPLAAEEGFDASGPASGEPLSCLEDFDQDGVPDSDEPAPITFAEQVRVQQATNLSVDPSLYDDMPPGYRPYPTRYIDIDSNEVPENEYVSASRRYNVGGWGAGEGEQAMLVTDLPGDGREYIIVVGDVEGSAGSYDLCVRRIVE